MIGLVRTLGEVDQSWANEHLSPPAAATVPMIKATLAAASKRSFQDLVAAATAGDIGKMPVADMHAAIIDLVEAALEIVSASLSESLKNVEGLSNAVPAFGAIVMYIAELIIAIASRDKIVAETRYEALVELDQLLVTKCRDAVAADVPFGTSVNGKVTPADVFRKLAYEYHKFKTATPEQRVKGIGWKLPMNASSMYVMLCGGETQGFGMSREAWQNALGLARLANPRIAGIPAEVQRKMWRMIQTIMSTVQDPVAGYPVGDQGLTVMPLLQDVVRQYYVPTDPRLPTKGGWDGNFASILSDYVTGGYSAQVQKQVKAITPGGPKGAGVVRLWGSCAGAKTEEQTIPRYVNLGLALQESVMRYSAALIDRFWDVGKERWDFGRVAISRPQKRGVLVMPKGLLEQTAKDAESALTFKRGVNLGNVLLGVAAAGGAYYAARRYKLLGA